MRTWLLLVVAALFVSVFTVPGYAADTAECDLILKIQKYISRCELVAMYGPSESAKAKGIAELRKQFTSDIGKLKERAAKEKGIFKELQDALSQFDANLAQCSKCEHEYRSLLIDLTMFERCKKKSCQPMNEAKKKILGMAWKCSKGK